MLSNEQYIAPARLERRHVDAYYVDAVEQIFAETPLGDVGVEITARRADEASIERYFVIAADRSNLALLKRAQELHLHAERHFTDFVEEQGATVRADE